MSREQNTGLLPTSAILKNRWKVQKRLGAGAFGEIFSAVDIVNGEEVAVKIEPSDVQRPVLKTEAHVMRRLQKSKRIVRYILDGQTEFFYFLVMEQLGENLADLRRKMIKGHFSLATTLRLGIQMIDALEDVHNLGFLHRDVKPSNFVVGKKSSDKIYLIDFGLSRKFVSQKGVIRPPRKNCGFRGTARYASIHAHFGKDLSRRDDLWSVFYLLVEFAIGSLPWRKIKDKKIIADLKLKYTNAELVKDLPVEFVMFMKHLQELRYEDVPDYNYLRALLQQAYNREGFSMEQAFDWQDAQCIKDNNSKQKEMQAAGGDAQMLAAIQQKQLPRAQLPQEENYAYDLNQQGHYHYSDEEAVGGMGKDSLGQQYQSGGIKRKNSLLGFNVTSAPMLHVEHDPVDSKNVHSASRLRNDDNSEHEEQKQRCKCSIM